MESMKNRLKSSKIELGSFLASLSVLGTFWERPGSSLGASWSLLGGSRWLPGSQKGSPHGPPLGPKTLPKLIKNPVDFFIELFVRFWSQNGPRMAPPKLPFIDPKSDGFFDRFFIDFFMICMSLSPWKWAPRLHEKLIFTKSPFLMLAWFWRQKWWKKAPRIESKWLQKTINNSRYFWADQEVFLEPTLY